MIIGFTGRMGSGKNEAAKQLASMYPKGKVVEISFARKLKESASALLDISLDDIERWKNDPHIRVVVRGTDGYAYADMGFRGFLQRFGTEAHRNVFSEDFWLDAALPLDGPYDSDVIYAVTDVRFQNEADRVRDLGGTVVRVIGNDEKKPTTHRSEDIPGADFVIHNTERNDDFLALREQLYYLVEGLSPSSKPADPAHHPEFASAEEIYGADEPREYIIVFTETCRLIV